MVRGFQLLFAALSMGLIGVVPLDVSGQSRSNSGSSSLKDSQALLSGVVRAVGGKERLLNLKDVELLYTYDDHVEGKQNISVERYQFEEGRSWARYLKHEKTVLPDRPGEVIQGFDGDHAWMTLEGSPIVSEQDLKLARFQRRANYWWLTMMFYLADAEIQSAYLGVRQVDGTPYDVVEVRFEEGVGDAQDTYVLYIHPETHLVDQFLFTIRYFNLEGPWLMQVEYEEVEGLRLPLRRSYATATWEGRILQAGLADQVMSRVRFKNGFSPEQFEAPHAERP